MTKQMDALNHINLQQRHLSHDWFNYWKEYSSVESWQFWFEVVLFIIPLIVIFLKIDRTKAFQIGFFGFNIHVWLGYIDSIGTKQGYWEYPYQMFIFMPNSVVLDASLVPVLFMLLYQWILHNQKNYFFYMFLLSAILSFIFKPLLASLNMLKFYQGTNYFHLFLGYVVIIVLSKFITDIFLKIQKSKTVWVDCFLIFYLTLIIFK